MTWTRSSWRRGGEREGSKREGPRRFYIPEWQTEMVPLWNVEPPEDEVTLLLSGLVENKEGFGGKCRGKLIYWPAAVYSQGVFFEIRHGDFSCSKQGPDQVQSGRRGKIRASPARPTASSHQVLSKTSSLAMHRVKEETDCRSPWVFPVFRGLKSSTSKGFVRSQLKGSKGVQFPSGDVLEVSVLAVGQQDGWAYRPSDRATANVF
jgi:hypothetical protein